jgi:hypothetical protein
MSWTCQLGVSDDCAEGDPWDAPCEINGKDCCIHCKKETNDEVAVEQSTDDAVWLRRVALDRWGDIPVTTKITLFEDGDHRTEIQHNFVGHDGYLRLTYDGNHIREMCARRSYQQSEDMPVTDANHMEVVRSDIP